MQVSDLTHLLGRSAATSAITHFGCSGLLAVITQTHRSSLLFAGCAPGHGAQPFKNVHYQPVDHEKRAYPPAPYPFVALTSNAPSRRVLPCAPIINLQFGITFPELYVFPRKNGFTVLSGVCHTPLQKINSPPLIPKPMIDTSPQALYNQGNLIYAAGRSKPHAA